MFRCYAIGLNHVQRQNVNDVVDQSSADDESWNNSSESSCGSNCSASSTPRHGGGDPAGDKYFKIGKRSSQYRTCGGKKTKKKIRNEHSQRHSALVSMGGGVVRRCAVRSRRTYAYLIRRLFFVERLRRGRRGEFDSYTERRRSRKK